MIMTLTRRGCKIMNQHGKYVLTVDRSDKNRYKLVMNISCKIGSVENLELWHKILGHVNYKLLQTLSSTQLVRGFPLIKSVNATVYMVYV